MKGRYAKRYSDGGFWRKVRRYARPAGKAVLEPALKLYYAAQDPDTPAWARTVIYGALGYFIVPLDAIPDLTPVAGFSDDLGALVAAVAVVGAHLRPAHARKARETLKEWFG